MRYVFIYFKSNTIYMLSKNQIKFIHQLKRKKHRLEQGLFLAEGIKLVEELLRSELKVHKLYATAEYETPVSIVPVEVISERELKSISDFTSPNQVLGIFEIPAEKEPVRQGLTVLLDGINDPGNLGTILRLCDWFGVEQLVCSPNTVDCYNSKVVQASMGSLARVSVAYCDLLAFIQEERRPVYGTFLDGENLYETSLDPEAVLILGNEANGISKEVEKLVFKKLTIPQFGSKKNTESLNVAMATAIFLSEFRR